MCLLRIYFIFGGRDRDRLIRSIDFFSPSLAVSNEFRTANFIYSSPTSLATNSDPSLQRKAETIKSRVSCSRLSTRGEGHRQDVQSRRATIDCNFPRLVCITFRGEGEDMLNVGGSGSSDEKMPKKPIHFPNVRMRRRVVLRNSLLTTGARGMV